MLFIYYPTCKTTLNLGQIPLPTIQTLPEGIVTLAYGKGIPLIYFHNTFFLYLSTIILTAVKNNRAKTYTLQ